MKSDIDRLMAERDLDAFIIFGDETPNPHRAYITNGHESNAQVFKKRGQPAVMVTNAMEVENAKLSGLEVLTYNEFKLHELWQAHPNDSTTRAVKTFERYLERFGITSGRVGVYGAGDIGAFWELLKLLDAHFTDIEFVGERETTLFSEAVTTKDAEEIKIMKDVGRRTNLVMQATWDFIAGHRSASGVVLKENGDPLTIGDVKQFVRLKLLEYELEDTEGMIFAQGRDGGFPHSHGADPEALETGKAIVFDLFPRDMRTGYYHDMTRTWSIGHATPEVQKAFDEVKTAFDAVMNQLKIGERTRKYQEITLDVLEEFGHPTSRTEPGTSIGYMHSLGHGLGLEVHESPAFSHMRDKDMLQVGNVFTVEPGVYYPDRGFGIRIEDTVYVAEDGHIESLTPMHKNLVLELRG
jgi:Xaa-Pro aminopeptidase